MHQALLVPEVLLEIFAHVTEVILKPFGPARFIVVVLYRESLAALATTCRAFHEPAMDLLWDEIEIESLLGCVTRLHPLIYCSGRLWNWAEGVRPLSTDEVHQFLRHSARVRSLTIISNRLLHLFSVIPAELYDFPRLRSLTISTRYMNLFLSHTLHVAIDEDLQSIVTCCATLEHLCVITPDALDAVDSTADAVSRISLIVRSCKQLITLSCPLFDWAAWRHLSNLPTLTTLVVGDTRSDPAPPCPLERDIANFSPFSNVTALSFMLDSAPYAIAVMQHSQFPSLKEFKMDVDFLSSPEAEQLFRALSNCESCKTLEKIIVLSLYHEYDDDDDTPNNSLSAIPHFHCFTQLQTLHLACFNFCINLDDDILLEAMSTWPHMRDLEIEDLRMHYSPITFRGIFRALHLCPQLHTLQVPIDGTAVNIDVEPIQHTSLRVLELKTLVSQIANAEALARIIFSCLPRINELGGIAYWDEVNMHLKSLKDAALHATGTASNT